MVVTDDKLNDTRTRHLLNPKNTMQKQNLFEIDLNDKLKFDEQNPIFDSRLSKIESDKLPDKSVKTFLNKAQKILN